MSRALILLSFSTLAACDIREDVSQKFTGVVAKAFVDAIAQAADTYVQGLKRVERAPAAWRASLGMSCGSQALCAGESPAEDDQCASELPVWRDDFLSLFGSCLSEGETREACFDSTRSAVPVGAEESARAQACRWAVATCDGVETDACEALEVLSYPELIQGVEACTHTGCDSMQSCFLQAFLKHQPEPSDIEAQCAFDVVYGSAPKADAGR